MRHKSDRSSGRKPKVNKDPAGVRPKKQLGQHFLTDLGIARRIAGTLTLEATSNVLEIGPGTGVLTRLLLERPVNLLAVELDPESAAFLQHSFLPGLAGQELAYRRFEVLQADFLKMDLEGLFQGEPFAITGNFPYNISTQIVFRLLEARARVPEFSGMFQKEVAERICAGPGSKAYGILSVLVQAYYEATYCFSVPPHVFHPPPKVDSGVLRLNRKAITLPGLDEAFFFRLVKTAFNQRRKTLRNSLKGLGLSDILKEDAIFDRRPEQLGVSEFIALSKRISDDTV